MGLARVGALVRSVVGARASRRQACVGGRKERVGVRLVVQAACLLQSAIARDHALLNRGTWHRSRSLGSRIIQTLLCRTSPRTKQPLQLSYVEAMVVLSRSTLLVWMTQRICSLVELAVVSQAKTGDRQLGSMTTH